VPSVEVIPATIVANLLYIGYNGRWQVDKRMVSRFA
jgi:hypothetical protein